MLMPVRNLPATPTAGASRSIPPERSPTRPKGLSNDALDHVTMAHINGTSSLSRARSIRAPAHASKPSQSAARGAAPGVTSTTTVSPPTASPTAPSHLTLFLTNLRLLDLDLRPDWPDINTLTFSARDAAQGQKKRIQSVEWALYHLFRLWDADEARNKLQPFFPPLDQVQSLNLRAALLRGLEHAKKNGVLGRDAVVRKTMLDECKGERLEEVLAVLSSAVLKKMVAERQLNGRGYPALAQTLALENRGYSGERAELTALILAHRVSLRRTLEEKNAARARFREFSEFMASKEKTISKRRETAVAAKRSGQGQAVSEAQKRDVWRTLRNNWTGDERWMEALVYGDTKARKDGVLTAPYDRVWRRVQSGRLAELDLEDTSVGLLEQLDCRVRGQQERLVKWQGFRQRMFGKTASEHANQEPERQSKKKGIDLGFVAHENLHLGRMSPRKLHGVKRTQLDSHYEALVDGLKSDLVRITPAAPTIPSFFQKPRRERPPRNTYAEAEPESISDFSDLEEAQPLPRPSPSRREVIRVAGEPAFQPVLRKAKTFDEEHVLPSDEPPTPSRLRRSATIQSHSPSARASRRRPLYTPDSPTKTPERRPSSPPKPKPQPSTPPRLAHSPPRLAATSTSPEPPPSPERPVSPTQQLADQILASVSAASPSPIKKPRRALSLAERTRLSMARRTSHANLRVPADEDGFGFDEGGEEEEEGELEEVDRLPIKRAPVPVPIPVVAEPSLVDGVDDGGGEEEVGYEDLVARTRRSMAGFEAAKKKAQLERRRSLRNSKLGGPSPCTPVGGGKNGYFPAVDEEEGDSTLLIAEELISKGRADDYEAVFMSRPKLKTSPIGTPTRELWD